MSKTCAACMKKLNESQWRNDETMKSCPSCSTANGREHVFLPHPDAFGETLARSSTEDPGGSQSWCSACRGKKGPQFGELCTALPR